MIEHGQWEPHIRKIMRHTLRQGDCYIDVGANIGLHSLYAGRLVGQAGRMVLFEPNINTNRLLQLNLIANGLMNISDCRAEAVSNVRGRKKFYSFANFSGMSGFSSSCGWTIGDGKKHVVKTVSLDSVCEENSITPKLLKIDVEGYERDVLLGAQKLLATSPEITVIMEWVPEEVRECLGDSALDDSLDIFAGYNCYLARYMQPLKKMDVSDHVSLKACEGGDLVFTKMPHLEVLVGHDLDDEERLG